MSRCVFASAILTSALLLAVALGFEMGPLIVAAVAAAGTVAQVEIVAAEVVAAVARGANIDEEDERGCTRLDRPFTPEEAAARTR